MADKIIDLLRRMSIFERLPETELSKIARTLKERRYAENQVLFRQGDQGDALYVVTHGRVKMAITDQFGREKVLAFLGEGQVFGEMALLTDAPRSATAVATTDLKVLQLRKDDFDVLMSNSVDLMKEMLRVLSERQAATNQRVSQEASAEGGAAHGQLTVVFSPRGGAGRSTIAVNLAIAMTQLTPDRVALVDLALTFGHLAILLNLSPRTALSAASPNALRQMDRESFHYYLSTHEDSSLRLLVAAQRPEDGELVTSEHIHVALNVLRRQFVDVVVDTSPSFSDSNLAAIESADRVLLVCTPDLGAVRDMRECQRIFFDLLGYSRERFRLVLNHPFPYEGVSTAEIEAALGMPVAAEIPFGGSTPSLAALEGHPLVSRWPTNPASRAIVALAGELDRAAKEALALAGR